MDKKKIFITDYIPSLNKGEAAILYGMIENFNRFLDCDTIYLWSNNSLIDKKRFEPEVEIIDGTSLSFNNEKTIIKVIKLNEVIFRYLLFIILYKLLGKKSLSIMKHKVWETFCVSDLIIVAHDDTLGSRGFSYSCALNILMCFFLKKPCIIYAVSMGMCRSHILNFFLKFLLSNVELITFREELSYSNCRKIIRDHPNMHVVMDPAFLLEPASDERIDRLMALEFINLTDKPIIGITVAYNSPVCTKLFSGFNKVRNKYKRHTEIISQIIYYLMDKFDALVILIPHVIGPGKNNDDRIISKDIFLKLDDKNKVRLIEKEYSPQEIKGLIGRLDFFIGERLHSVFNAISMGVPAVALSFPSDYRAYGIIGRALGEMRLLYNVEFLEYDTLLEKINEIYKIRDQVRKDLIFKIPHIKEQVLLTGKLIRNLF